MQGEAHLKEWAYAAFAMSGIGPSALKNVEAVDGEQQLAYSERQWLARDKALLRGHQSRE